MNKSQGFPRLAKLYGSNQLNQAPTMSRYGLIIGTNSEALISAVKGINPAATFANYFASEEINVTNWNGTTYGDWDIHPGWWLTLAGTTLTTPVGTQDTVLQVADASVIQSMLTTNPDILVGSESMHVVSVDTTNNAITVQRGYRSVTAPHQKDERVAAHATIFPNTWQLNITQYCPVNAYGQTWVDYLITKMTEMKDGSMIDGFFLDNMMWNIAHTNGGLIDADMDNVADGGQGATGNAWTDGINTIAKRTKSIFASCIVLANSQSAIPNVDGELFENFSFDTYWNHEMQQYLYGAPTFAPFSRLSIINVTTQNTGVIKYVDMRLGLAATLMNNGYYTYDYGGMAHGSTWWFDEYDNGVGTSLAKAIGTTDTSITVATGTGALFNQGDTLMLPCTDSTLQADEIVTVQSISGDVLTIQRAQNGTTATNHGVGAKVITQQQVQSGLGWLGNATQPPRNFGNGVWSRAFENGYVVLNQSTTAQMVTIPSGYRRIKGTQAPVWNNGQPVGSSITIPARDAILLVKII